MNICSHTLIYRMTNILLQISITISITSSFRRLKFVHLTRLNGLEKCQFLITSISKGKHYTKSRQAILVEHRPVFVQAALKWARLILLKTSNGHGHKSGPKLTNSKSLQKVFSAQKQAQSRFTNLQ